MKLTPTEIVILQHMTMMAYTDALRNELNAVIDGSIYRAITDEQRALMDKFDALD